jgi:hypothetical protein
MATAKPKDAVPTKKGRAEGDMPSLPFDDALRKILASPPKHKTATVKGKKKTGS